MRELCRFLSLALRCKSTYIPATQRPDGSWRKARRVKDGYIPQDEMPLYESKGKQWAKNRPGVPVGLDPAYVAPVTTKSKKIPGLSEANTNETTTKSTKKKKKKSDSQKSDVTNRMGNLDISSKNSNDDKILTTNNIQKSQPVATDPAKRIRNLKKKLRDINALKLRIESGELANPEKDQLEKIARKEEIEAEIEELELELEKV
ncbi:partner of Y14 and mago isoform X2 [Parasteatoda tepidariorum]|uniref:partner of Y14 and mago isoform X2 n=1 Tax=Parasteatoda tepidariorum TaxID=114398 RepID=UPI001C719C86|nr:partner of Y14 and mago isoform X2 [Parasteatoda tepidariorum]